MNDATRNVQSAPPARRPAMVRPALRYAVSLCGALALVAAASMGGIAAAHAATENGDASHAGATQSAHWVQKKINFTYQGFTTRYSCDGLTDKVKQVLLQLGARKSDLRVHEAGCTASFGRPEPFPSVVGTFYVLEPASSAGDQSVKAEWQTVNVRVGRPGLDQAGQCELIDQVKTRILPLFAARNVQFESSCVPHQLTIKGSSLTVQVLKPVGRSKEVARTAP